MVNLILKILISLYYGILLLVGLDGFFYKMQGTPKGYPGQGFVSISHSLFWHEWIDHCYHFDAFSYTKYFWGLSGIIGGLLIGYFLKNLFQNQINDELSDLRYPGEITSHSTSNIVKMKVKYLIFFTILFSISLGSIFLSYEKNTSFGFGNLFTASIFEFFPFLISFVYIGSTYGGIKFNSPIKALFAILFLVSLIFSLLFIALFGLFICA